MTQAKNTRVAVRLDEEVYDAVSTIARLTRSSRGDVLAQLLEPSSAALIKLAAALESAEAVRAKAISEISSGALSAILTGNFRVRRADGTTYRPHFLTPDD